MSLTLEQLKERQSGFGGSDAASVLGVNPFMTALELYESKIYEITEVGKPTPQQERGNVLEPIAADRYALKTGRKIAEREQKRHPEYNFMIGNVDREIIGGDDIDSPGILEIKCPGFHIMAEVKAHGLKDYMIVQLQHYLAVYGYSWGSFAVFHSENMQLIHFDLEADQDFISTLIEKEEAFWFDHIYLKVPLPIDPDAPLIEIPQVEGDLITIDEFEWREAARDLQEAVTLKKTAVDLEKLAKETIQGLMDDRGTDAVEIPDQARFYYRTHDGRTSWKKTAEKLAMESGLPLSEFLEVGKPYRSFRSYFMGRGGE